MDIKQILSHVDHTLLAQNATWPQIQAICDDGIAFGTASVCIPPSFVKRAKEYVGDKLAICTVVGFPLGYNTTPVKVFETQQAVADGADEIDMVLNVGALKEGNHDYVRSEIAEIKQACQGKLLKVIIETCLLTDEEKVVMCHLVTEAGADFIKTSTGFSTGGATLHDVELFVNNVGPGVRAKAAGGISTIEDAEAYLKLGADRLGTSRIVKIAKQQAR